MDNDTKSRQQKLFEKLYPYFGDLARNANQDEYAVKICRRVLRLRENAIDSKDIADFITIWDSEHPEEDSLTNAELLWALDCIDDYFSSQLRDFQLLLTKNNDPSARFKLINGGRPMKVGDPYANEPDTGHEIDF